MSKEMNMIEIVNRLKNIQDEYGRGIEPADDDALSAAIILLSNMTNLQMALYDVRSLEYVTDIVSEHLCFDNKLGIIVSHKSVKCSYCMFHEDDKDCPELFKQWLIKKITEVEVK